MAPISTRIGPAESYIARLANSHRQYARQKTGRDAKTPDRRLGAAGIEPRNSQAYDQVVVTCWDWCAVLFVFDGVRANNR